MSFVNEYVPDPDIDAYDLNGIWDKYYPFYKGEFFFGNRPHWTVDRGANTFLMSIGIGRNEHGNRRKFLLWIDGRHVVAELDLLKGSSGDLDANPFIRIWDLARIEIPEELQDRKAEILATLKAAVSVFGYWGAWDQRPNTVVEFRF